MIYADAGFLTVMEESLARDCFEHDEYWRNFDDATDQAQAPHQTKREDQ